MQIIVLYSLLTYLLVDATVPIFVTAIIETALFFWMYSNNSEVFL